MSEFPKHMMATSADHKLGDISRETPQLAIISDVDPETGEYIGNWVYGFGLIGVKFAADTTRDLTPEEVLDFEEKSIKEPGMPARRVKIIGYDNIERPSIANERPRLGAKVPEQGVVIDGVDVPPSGVAWARDKVDAHRELDAQGDDPNVYIELDGKSVSAAAIVWAAEGRPELVIDGCAVSPETVERAWQAAAFGSSRSFNLGVNDQGEAVVVEPAAICRQGLGTSPTFWDNLGH